MNSKRGREQTTKGRNLNELNFIFKCSYIINIGVWFGKDEENPFLIMDVEGTDSTEHWGQKYFDYC